MYFHCESVYHVAAQSTKLVYVGLSENSFLSNVMGRSQQPTLPTTTKDGGLFSGALLFSTFIYIYLFIYFVLLYFNSSSKGSKLASLHRVKERKPEDCSKQPFSRRWHGW